MTEITDFSLSVVIPAYNEEAVIEQCHERVSKAAAAITHDYEIIYVNDGSQDNTQDILDKLAKNDPHICLIRLSRNYGKEIALSAGLDQTGGDIAIILDADLQDPPELMSTFVEHWQQGYDVVYGQRIQRDGETWLKKKTASLFYQLINRISDIDIPKDTGDFRLMSRRSIDSLARFREQHRFMKGLFAWVGYPQKAVPYRRDARVAGTTKWNYFQLFNLAIEGITSFSTSPLKLSTYVGITTALLAFCYGFFIIVKTMIFGDPVAGYPSLMVAILFIGGVQLIAIGVLGEYVGRTFDESKGRPLYLVSEFHQSNLKPYPNAPKKLH